MKPLLPRWLRRGEELDIEAVRRGIDRQFLYRGASTLELRTLRLEGGGAQVAFYARPIFPGDRRIQHRTREAAFSEQLFHDAVTVLNAIWHAAPAVDTIDLSAWIKTVDAVGSELCVVSAHATRAAAARIPAGARLAPADVLRRYAARTRIDRHGNFHEERPL